MESRCEALGRPESVADLLIEEVFMRDSILAKKDSPTGLAISSVRHTRLTPCPKGPRWFTFATEDPVRIQIRNLDARRKEIELAIKQIRAYMNSVRADVASKKQK